MKRFILTLVCLFGLGLSMIGQEPIKTWSTNPPPAAMVIGTTYANATNTNTSIYYWLITNYTAGSVLYPYPVSVTGITAGDPSGAHPIVVSWNPVAGATGYSVVETSTPSNPTLPCAACLVGTVSSGTTQYSDTGAGYTALSPTFIKPATGDIRLNSKDYASAAFEYTVNGATSALSPIACVGSPGNTVGSYRVQCQTSGVSPVLYLCKNTAGCTVAADWFAAAGSGTFVTLSGDAVSTAVGGATTVKGANSVLYSSLGTGILKNITGTGVPSIAVAADFPMLGVAQGGTGLATLTAHALYVGNTTSAPTALAVGATDKPLVGVTGANPAFSKLTLTNPATAATLTIADNKSLTVSNIMTLAGTDGQTYTFPSTSATIARTDAANTFTGVQTMTSPILTTPNLGTPSAIILTNATGLPAAQVPPVSIITPGTTPTLVAPKSYAICTGTCTVTVPVPAAGYEFCVYNDDNVSTAITLSALGSGAMYENSARTAYGTAGTGTLVVAAAAADMVCIVGRDSTHYLTTRSSGTVTVN